MTLNLWQPKNEKIITDVKLTYEYTDCDGISDDELLTMISNYMDRLPLHIGVAISELCKRFEKYKNNRKA